jgi:hypothetical protein
MGLFLWSSNLTKKWVFESLVKNERDPIGLIAYALYKHKKHALALSLREGGKDEVHIQQQIQTFHDQTLHNDSLGDYREKANSFLNKIVEVVERDISCEFEKEKTKLEKQHIKDIAAERRKLFKQIKTYQHTNRSTGDKLVTWILSGIPGIISSFLEARGGQVA